MKELLLCVSASSGAGNALKIGPQVAKLLSRNGWHVTIKLTGMEDVLSKIAENTSHEYIAALGGDGYISAIADGIRKTNKVLMPLPAGRGNDFCRKLEIGTDAIAFLENNPQMQVENVDVAIATDKNGKEKTILGILSLGIDSVANQYANTNRFLKGMPVYIWGFLKAVKNFRPLDYILTIDGEEIKVKSWSTLVSSTGIYGGGIKILPVSDIRDGILDILTLENLSFWELMRQVPTIIKGNHLSHPSMVVRHCKEVTVDCETEFLPYSDGDPTGVLPITVKVAEGALKVIH